MARLINIGFGNVVNTDKVVAVVSPDAAPVKRLVQNAKNLGSLVDATQGRKTKAVIVTEGEKILITRCRFPLPPARQGPGNRMAGSIFSEAGRNLRR